MSRYYVYNKRLLKQNIKPYCWQMILQMHPWSQCCYSYTLGSKWTSWRRGKTSLGNPPCSVSSLFWWRTFADAPFRAHSQDLVLCLAATVYLSENRSHRVTQSSAGVRTPPFAPQEAWPHKDSWINSSLCAAANGAYLDKFKRENSSFSNSCLSTWGQKTDIFCNDSHATETHQVNIDPRKA